MKHHLKMFAALAATAAVQLVHATRNVVPAPLHPAKLHAVSPPRTKTCRVPASGTKDAAPAILQAAKSCNNGGTVLFPAGTNYTIGTKLDLTFLKSVDLEIQGNIQVGGN